ncbi:hypothetical protein [Paramaledivibacter caminithermalis]|uniref:Carboxypeptidase regulatory-like domain-containing protein n=1 Tax=Paramaledivibacter caminithermalis (strain DSM 15212 / CIP 107654 / DViRD3) TaxID=1121301 RepID=A0A1M6NDX1_PARC5|nr:hypothetical protein [Paramaledivibacter caminithermalis]SHJ93890.1 hypothetical protein SAMN02745912_01699 [Paramaledivibacter caminithermalis DSM 15212]
MKIKKFTFILIVFCLFCTSSAFALPNLGVDGDCSIDSVAPYRTKVKLSGYTKGTPEGTIAKTGVYLDLYASGEKVKTYIANEDSYSVSISKYYTGEIGDILQLKAEHLVIGDNGDTRSMETEDYYMID